MNEGNVARAVFSTLFLDLPPLTEAQAQRAALAEKLFKAADSGHDGALSKDDLLQVMRARWPTDPAVTEAQLM